MVRDGESNAEKDRQFREEAEAKNKLDSLIYATQKTLTENRGKVTPELAKSMDDAIEDAKRDLNEGGTGRVTAAFDRLSAASQKFAEALYRTATAGGAAPPPGPSGPEAPPAGDVIDADYVDADGEKGK